ncbi:MAG: FHA domain-containing protein [Nitrococcus sp.]|nr:FHA domain-containing protein [Nitrococcus sp.]
MINRVSFLDSLGDYRRPRKGRHRNVAYNQVDTHLLYGLHVKYVIGVEARGVLDGEHGGKVRGVLGSGNRRDQGGVRPMEDKDSATRVLDVCALLQGDGTASIAAQLIVIHGGNVGQKVALNRPRTDIGRRDTNHLVLASATVSREHAHIISEEECYFVADAGSSNGVYVNGQKIPDGHRWCLNHGDIVALGELLLLLFHCPERLLNPQGLFDIAIDRIRVKQEADDLLARFIASDSHTASHLDEPQDPR